MKRYTRIWIGLLLLAMAMCEIAAWPMISWLDVIVPGSLISAGAVLIGGEVASERSVQRPERNGHHNYLVLRIMRQGGEWDERRPS